MHSSPCAPRVLFFSFPFLSSPKQITSLLKSASQKCTAQWLREGYTKQQVVDWEYAFIPPQMYPSVQVSSRWTGGHSFERGEINFEARRKELTGGQSSQVHFPSESPFISIRKPGHSLFFCVQTKSQLQYFCSTFIASMPFSLSS